MLGFDPQDKDASGACELSWTITMNSAIPVHPQVIGGASAPIPQAITRVEFTPPALPERVWWFRDFDSNSGTMDPNPDHLISCSVDYVYSREFVDLDREWWGLAWTWASEG